MKTLFSLVLLFACFSLTAQTVEKLSYYYQGKKQSFNVNNGRLVIQLSVNEYASARRGQMASLLHIPDTAISTGSNQKWLSAKLTAGVASSKIKGWINELMKLGFVDFVHPCFTSDYGKDMGYGDELVVKLKPGTSKTMLDNVLAQTRSNIVKKYAFQNDTYILSAGAANGYDALAIANRLFETGLFVYAEPDFTLFDGLFTDPNDPAFPYQWAHTNTGSAIQYNGVPGVDMKVQKAWDISTGAGITVAVIDEGVDTGHADLKANLLQGFDCVSGTANPGDGRPLGPSRGHGTCCAGIVAAVANNNLGIAGVAPNSKMIPINIAAANGQFVSNAAIASGFDYAWQHGADVISNSWGGGSPSSIIDDAINRCVTLGRGGKGAVVLFASGNNNAALSYPAVNPNVISVGGVNMCGKRKSPASSVCDGEGWGASFGTGLDVVAPCVKIYSTDITGTGGYNTNPSPAGDYFVRFNGTSSATPNAAGVAALVLGANSNLTVSQLRNVLEGSCDKLPSYNYSMVPNQPNGTWNNETGHGLVNAFSAVQTAVSGNYCHTEIQANGPTRLCPGGQVTLSVINPVAGTSYQWRKDAVNISTGIAFTATIAGSYDVIATALNGCVSASAPVIVTILTNTPALTASAGIDTFICAGQSVMLGGNPAAANGAPWLPEKRAYGMDWQGNSFVKFSLSNPLQLDTIAKNIVSNADYAAEKFFTGGDFTPYGYYAITQTSNKLMKVDTATGVQQLVGIAPAPAGYAWSGMSWDATTKTLYALASASSGSSLCSIDLFTAAVTPVATIPVGLTEWVAVSNAGNMYVMSENNYVYLVNKYSGSATPLPSSVGADVIFQQDADFDPVTDSLYLTTIIQYQNYVGDLRTVNTSTGISSVIGTLGGLSEIDATAIAGPGYLYNWSPAAGLNNTAVSIPVATPATTTTYTLQVTDMCGNTASSQVTVHVNKIPVAVITAATDSICVGESSLLHTEANSAYSYQWSLNGTAIAGATDSTYLATSGGAYTVHIVNGSCDSISQPFIVKTCELRLNDNTPVSLCATYFYDSGGATGSYGNGESFIKTITAATPGNLPQITFSSFNTEAANDVLTIYDGNNTAAPLLATLSGAPAMPLIYTGTSGSLTIAFSSNAAVTDAGWAATIRCYQPTVYRSKVSGDAADKNTWQVKSGNIFTDALSIPHVYDDSIIIQPGHTVTINAAMPLDQLWVKAGGALQVNAALTLNDGAGVDLLSDGALIISAAGNINGNGTLTVTGSLNNAASENSQVLVNTTIAGTTPQTIAAGAGFGTVYITNPSVFIQLADNISMDSLIINNAGGKLNITTAAAPSLLTVRNKLSLLSGRILSDSSAPLNLAASCITDSGSVNSFVQGPLRMNTGSAGLSSLFFPVGKDVYRPVMLNVNHLSAGASVYQAEVFNTAPAKRSLPATINAVTDKSYYTISNLGSQPISNAAITLGYNINDGVTDAAALRIAKQDGPLAWLDAGGTGNNNGTGSVTTTVNFTAFGDFVLANALGGSNAFAIRWLQATAVLAGKQVNISWTIGNESNIDYYLVERSADGVHFSSIATVNATAITAAEKKYDAGDRLPEKGINYYRIKQVAKDGRTSYSKILAVTVTETSDFILWPNPATSTVHVQNRTVIRRLQCFNASGQLLYDVQPASTQHNIPVQQWASGIYHVKITADAGVVQLRFIKK